MLRCIAIVGVLMASACSDAPSTQQCTDLLAKAVDFEVATAGANIELTDEMKAGLAKQKAAVSDAARESFMKTCTEKTSSDKVACALKAPSLAQMVACDE